MRSQKIGLPVNFKKAKRPNKNFLIGAYTILEPINVIKHVDDLFDNFLKDKNGKDWTYMPEGPFKEKKSFIKYLKDTQIINMNLTENRDTKLKVLIIH